MNLIWEHSTTNNNNIREEGQRLTMKTSGMYCNNCGKEGHVYHQCKLPVTSYGIVVFRKNPNTRMNEYLMICRKDTLGYIDFMRGKYKIGKDSLHTDSYNKNCIMNMLKQMTVHEKERIQNKSFDVLWKDIWGEDGGMKEGTKEEGAKEEEGTKEGMKEGTTKEKEGNQIIKQPTIRTHEQYKLEESNSKDRFNQLSNYGILSQYVEESIEKHHLWIEPEWGFPKGRRNNYEKDYDCAIREFVEETGYPAHVLKNCQNIFPFDEIFMGSNYKSYKHRYFLMYMDYDDSINTIGSFEKDEVSKMEWKTIHNCMYSIRDYNVEKKRLINTIDACLERYKICIF